MNIGPIMQPAVVLGAAAEAPAWFPHATGLLVLVAVVASLALLLLVGGGEDR